MDYTAELLFRESQQKGEAASKKRKREREARAEFDLVAQRFRAVEAANTEEGSWVWAQHLEVFPEVPRRLPTCGRQWYTKKERGYAVAGKVDPEILETESKGKGTKIPKTTPKEQAAEEPRPVQS